MEKRKFNVQEWLISPSGEKPKGQRGVPEPGNKNEPIKQDKFSPSGELSAGQRGDKYSEVTQIIEQIEMHRTDLTTSYEGWRNIGFALADEFGENGRELFHRVSQFHAEYDHQECDKQFDNCLKSKGSGVNINTLFYLAKNAGIELPKSKPVERPEYPKRRTGTGRNQETPNPSGYSISSTS